MRLLRRPLLRPAARGSRFPPAPRSPNRASRRLRLACSRSHARCAASGADERFGLCSTFKLPLAAAILREADAGRLALDTIVPYAQKDMVPHAPVTQAHLADGGMSIGALAEAAQTTSDNVAANLLVQLLGGPQSVTAMWREMGDPLTRIDRYEPRMNFVPAGEVRDTTTPRAMAAGVSQYVTGEVLGADSRALLRGWMIATETGKRRIRAGLPSGWIAGDKTGTAWSDGMPNKHNDVAVIWAPDRAPVIVAGYYERRASSRRCARGRCGSGRVGRIVAALDARPERHGCCRWIAARRTLAAIASWQRSALGWARCVRSPHTRDAMACSSSWRCMALPRGSAIDDEQPASGTSSATCASSTQRLRRRSPASAENAPDRVVQREADPVHKLQSITVG